MSKIPRPPLARHQPIEGARPRLLAAAFTACALAAGGTRAQAGGAPDGQPAAGSQAPPARGSPAVPTGVPVAPPGKTKPFPSAESLGLKQTRLDVHEFRVAERESGPISYYSIVEDPIEPFIRAVYRPPLETVVVGIEVPGELQQGARLLRWKWRAMALPKGGDECAPGKGDSAAVIYLAWKSFFRWYSLKLVWSTVGVKGSACEEKRNLLTRQDAIILESGGPTGVWVQEEVDLAAEFRKHFEDGDPNAEVPDFVGIGVMSDGDQTATVSAADYTGFAILH